MSKTYSRIIFDIVIFISIFVLPWWAIFSIAIVALFFTTYNYIEIIFWGALLDALYGGRIFTIIFFVLYIISLIIKNRLYTVSNQG